MNNDVMANKAKYAGILGWVDARSSAFTCILAALLVVHFGLMDWYTGHGLSYSIFFVIPLWLMARRFGFIGGVVISLLSATSLLWVGLVTGNVYSPFGVWNAFTNFAFFVIISYGLVRVRFLVDALGELASTDHLTGAANSRAFYEKAQTEIARSARYGRPFTAAYFDLDNFKTVNDTLGHNVGDDLLVRTVYLITQTIRETDFLARLGGDEFVILFSETDVEAAQEAIRRIEGRFHTEMKEKSLPVTLSVGLVTFVSPPVSVSEMIQMADKLMYEAKSGGKNRIISATYSEGRLVTKSPSV
jgi:diguanylate cyclase (GGDEF)-like protein